MNIKFAIVFFCAGLQLLSNAKEAEQMTPDPLEEFRSSSGSKALMNLSGRVVNGAVELSFYKSESAPWKLKGGEKSLYGSLRVYRLELPGFTFNFDYDEYFSGQDFRKAQIVFDGALTPQNDRKFTFLDKSVKPGMTYAYWAGAGDLAPVGPLPIKVRDSAVWWPAAKIQERMAQMAERHPELVSIEAIGRTANGRELNVIRAGHAKPCVALVGALHAGESGPELIIPAIERILDEKPGLLEKISILALPELNIDQREKLATGGVPWYLRRNGNGVDLNRNFPVLWEKVGYAYGLDTSDPVSETYRGPSPASEPETQAVMKWLQRERPLALFSFHCLASICGEVFLGGAPKTGAKSDFANPAKLYLLGMDPSAPVEKSVHLGGTTPGSLPSWCASELGIPAFDVEISFDREKEALEKCRYDHTDIALLEKYQDMHFKGIENLLSNLSPEARP